MRFLTLLLVALFLAACAPVPPKPTPKEPVVQIEEKPQVARFSALAMLGRRADPERDGIRDSFRYDRSIGVTEVDGLRYYFYKPGAQRAIVGFSFLNEGSKRINPAGLKRKGPRREYAFLFADRARENIHLAINDDVKLSGRFSHDNMFRELHFFPRRQLPSLEVDDARDRITVTLPTGEPVVFDRASREVVAGVLDEHPIDFNPSRHLRRNPDVRYAGDFIAITVAQRGEAPRRAKVWGQKKQAEIHYPAKNPKPCRVSPGLIWDQRPKPGDTDPKLTMLHETDASLFDMIEQQCRWDLADLRRPTRVLLRASDLSAPEQVDGP